MISTVLANIGQRDPILHVTKNVKGDQQSEWISIRTIEDPYVQEVAKFAVTEFDKDNKMATFQYKRLLRCWIKEEMGGLKYRLILEVKEEKAQTHQKLEGKYEAIVWEASGRLIIRKLKLISFMPCIHGLE